MNSKLTNDELMAILSPDGIFEQAEVILRKSGETQKADLILKVQQDAGLEFDFAFDPNDLSNPPGEHTARLWKAYEPLTKKRFETAKIIATKTLSAPSPQTGPQPE